jgi:hypothetical protein
MVRAIHCTYVEYCSLREVRREFSTLGFLGDKNYTRTHYYNADLFHCSVISFNITPRPPPRIYPTWHKRKKNPLREKNRDLEFATIREYTFHFLNLYNRRQVSLQRSTPRVSDVHFLPLNLFFLCCWIKAWEVADSTVMRKWKWMLVNGFECMSSIYTATEFF